MKKIFSILLLFVGMSVSMAWVTTPFSTWDDLIKNSTDIVVVRCLETPEPGPGSGGLLKVKIDVVNVLKGRTNDNSGPLKTSFWPRQGEYYLVFSRYLYGDYCAYAEHNVVPLGLHSHENRFVGKPLDEQVHTLLK